MNGGNKADTAISLRTPSRLHMALIDMNGGLGRVDGGVGIALEEPCFEMEFGEAEGVFGVSGEELRVARAVCDKLGVAGIEIAFNRRIPEHVGFGSKTQVSLGIAAGINRVYGVGKSVRELAALVGRGGTSGIGVAAFESGGFILDGGHPAVKGFFPSRCSKAPPAPVLARYDFPWHVVCAWPAHGAKGAHGGEEAMLFKKACPIPASEAGKVSRIILMKLLPALAEGDVEAFGGGVNRLQSAGFKKMEVGIKKKEVGKLLAHLQKNSAGAGMSSFGPVCYGICGTAAEAASLRDAVLSEFGENNIKAIKTRAINTGASLS